MLYCGSGDFFIHIFIQNLTINHSPSTTHHQPPTINHPPSTTHHQSPTINHYQPPTLKPPSTILTHENHHYLQSSLSSTIFTIKYRHNHHHHHHLHHRHFITNNHHQTKAVLRQAWLEGLRVVLVLNKVDRLVLEVNMHASEAVLRLMQIVEQVGG